MLVAATGSVPIFSRLLSLSPLVRIGRVSYGLYLWHYVIFKAFTHSGIILKDVEKIHWIAVSVAAAVLPWVVIEQPALRHKSDRQ